MGIVVVAEGWRTWVIAIDNGSGTSRAREQAVQSRRAYGGGHCTSAVTDQENPRAGRKPDVASALNTTCTNPGFLNWTEERLTAIFKSSGQPATVAQAFLRAHSPSWMMKPFSSAKGMNSPGEIHVLLGMTTR